MAPSKASAGPRCIVVIASHKGGASLPPVPRLNVTLRIQPTVVAGSRVLGSTIAPFACCPVCLHERESHRAHL